MAIDSNTPKATDQAAAIENEIPAYRAISPMAICSLLLGLFSVLCFANSAFLVAAAAATVTGILADRKIRRMPDVLTGRGLAHAGLGLGLAFGLASLTIDAVQGYLRKTEATKFARSYIDVLKKGSVAEALWYRLPPDSRQEITPEQAVEQLEAGAKMDPGMPEQRKAPINAIKSRLASGPDQQLAFDEIEQHGINGLEPYAFVLLRLSGPGSSQYPAEEEFALLGVKGRPVEGRLGWWVDELEYPYKPKSHVVQEKPVDDGHGHGGGGHGHAH